MARIDVVKVKLEGYRQGMMLLFFFIFVVGNWLAYSDKLRSLDLYVGGGVIVSCCVGMIILWSKRSILANELESL